MSFTGGKIKSDCLLNFTSLSLITAEEENILVGRNEYLTGEHDKFIHSFEKPEEEIDMSDLNQIIQRGNRKRDLKEIHFVSYLVKHITNDSALVPKNAFYLDFNNNLRPEENFRSEREFSFDKRGYERLVEPS